MIFLYALSTAGMSTTTTGQESSTCWSLTIRRRRRRPDPLPAPAGRVEWGKILRGYGYVRVRFSGLYA